MKIATWIVGLAAVGLVGSASAGLTFDVYAMANSSSGGVGLPTITLSAGQAFSVSASPLDIWNAGPPYRMSNANGLKGTTFAVAGDDSGVTPGLKIGDDYGLYTQGGFAAPYGSLVGQIGATYFLLGTSFQGTASSSGLLKLFYWDSNNYDNTGSITATVTPVPEASTYLAGIGALAIMGLSAWNLHGRRTTSA